MKVEIIHDSVVSPNVTLGQEKVVSVYPHVIKLDDGSLMCLYRQGSAKHSHDGILLFQFSEDRGESWSEPGVVFDGMQETVPESVMTGAHCQLQDGEILVLFKTVEVSDPDIYIFSDEGRKIPSHLYLTRSIDRGAGWSDPKPFEIAGNTMPLFVGTRPEVLPDGSVMAVMEAAGKAGQHLTLTATSSDRGNSFGPAAICAYDPGAELSYGDAKVTVLPDGRLFTLNWTFTRESERTLNVHSCISRDNGKSWQGPVDIGLECQIMVPLMLDDSRMIAVGNIRNSSPGIYLWQSLSLGKSWDKENPVLLWDAVENRITGIEGDVCGVSREGEKELWDSLPGFTFGTPDLVRMDDGTVLMTYYAVIGGITHIRCCRFLVKG